MCLKFSTPIVRKLSFMSLNVGGVNDKVTEYYSGEESSFLARAGDFHLARVQGTDIYDLPGDQYLPGRYSALYRKIYPVGTQEEFNLRWNKVYAEQEHVYHRVFADEIPKMAARGKMWTFDCLAKAFRRADFEFTKSLSLYVDEHPEELKELDALYDNFTRDPQSSISKVISYITRETPDIICLQEVTESQVVALERLEDYNLTSWSKGTITLYSKRLPFRQLAAWKNIFGETVYVGNKSLIIVNTHCTAKKPSQDEDNYETQFRELISQFADVKQQVIIMGDFNHNIYAPQYQDFILPFDLDAAATCNKKRTAFQMQKKKINAVDAAVKDGIFLIDNNAGRAALSQQLNGWPRAEVRLLDGRAFSMNTYLPNNVHPTDHAALCISAALVIGARARA